MTFTPIVNLQMMENTVRRMTARYTPQQMTDEQIDNYINLSYTIHMPLNFKNLKLTKPYVFTTIPNVDTYPFYYENGLPQTKSLVISIPTGSIGNSAASPWSITTLFSSYVPPIIPPANSTIIPGSVKITIATGTPIVFTDTGTGILISQTAGNSGTINYQNGDVILTHTAGAGVTTTASFNYSVANDPNINVEGNIQITPPVYCQGYILRYYQDKTTFYNRWPNLSVNQQINTGTGTLGAIYSGTIPSTPFYRAQLDIFGNVTEAAVIISAFDNSGFNYTLTDVPLAGSNTGNLIEATGIVVGTVNYFTGAYFFTPSATSIPTTANIFAAVVPYQSSRPTDVLFYNQQIVFRPCPQQIYQVEFQISQQPTQLIANNDAPELNEWYLFICAGAAKLIYTDFPDEDGMAQLMPIWQEQLQIAQRRSLRQMGSQRASTIFSQPGRPLASWFWGTEYSGTSG